MKKILFFIGAMLLSPTLVSAANANIDISTSNSNISKGDTISVTATVSSTTPISSYEYTLDYDHNSFTLVEGRAFNTEHSSNNNSTKFTKSFKFKVNDLDNSKISVKSYAVYEYGSEDDMNVTVSPLSINGDSSSSNKASSNNYLSSLEVVGYKFSPSFSKNTNDYVLKIDSGETDIEIKATAEDKNARVRGTGKYTLSSGDNKIDIVVTSPSGDTRTYSILITMEDKSPITIKVFDEEYVVIKNITSSIFENFKVSNTKINDKKVDSLYNDEYKITLISAKDKDNNVYYFNYDSSNNSYYPYFEIKTENTVFIPINSDEKFLNYEKYDEVIKNVPIKCYKSSKKSNYCIMYGMNLKTGNKDFYVYDKQDESIQKYNGDIDSYYNSKLESGKSLIYILSFTTLFFGILAIISVIHRKAKKASR